MWGRAAQVLKILAALFSKRRDYPTAAKGAQKNRIHITMSF